MKINFTNFFNRKPDDTTDGSWYVNRDNNTTAGQPCFFTQGTVLELTKESRADYGRLYFLRI